MSLPNILIIFDKARRPEIHISADTEGDTSWVLGWLEENFGGLVPEDLSGGALTTAGPASLSGGEEGNGEPTGREWAHRHCQ